LAEWYPTEESVEAGDIVAMGPETSQYMAKGADPETGQEVEIGTTTISVLIKAGGSSTILGVVSTAPHTIIGEDVRQAFSSSRRKPIALTGRVPVKVNLSGGPILAGDRIALSESSGVGMRARTSDESVGIALEPYDGSSGKDKIMLFIDRRYHVAQNQASQEQGSLELIVEKVKKSILEANDFLVKIIRSDVIYIRENLEVGTSENPKGITLYDQDTKAPYCVVVKGGKVESLSGKCPEALAIPAEEVLATTTEENLSQ
jgi:hypothetical protein